MKYHDDVSEEKSLPKVYTLAEAADLLKVKPITIRRLIERNIFHPLREIRHIRLPAKEVNLFLSGDYQSKNNSRPH